MLISIKHYRRKFCKVKFIWGQKLWTSQEKKRLKKNRFKKYFRLDFIENYWDPAKIKAKNVIANFYCITQPIYLGAKCIICHNQLLTIIKKYNQITYKYSQIHTLVLQAIFLPLKHYNFPIKQQNTLKITLGAFFFPKQYQNIMRFRPIPIICYNFFFFFLIEVNTTKSHKKVVKTCVKPMKNKPMIINEVKKTNKQYIFVKLLLFKVLFKLLLYPKIGKKQITSQQSSSGSEFQVQFYWFYALQIS
eukprot:TRINITY_DN15789_c0_g1_i1.p1 TRINITY_DN15789_c0_g1~~TRINITY_DN15789_c0_g1_i1.p1  ORF type:complete len:247 (-),score=-20.96 TRINITY_DN15789_c0_g1_i1:40-780(-)